MAFAFQTSFSFISKHNKFRQLSEKEKLKSTNPVQSYEFLNQSWESYGAKIEKCHNFPNPFRFISFFLHIKYLICFNWIWKLKFEIPIRRHFFGSWESWYPSITFPTKKVCRIWPKFGTYLENKMHSVTGQLILHGFEIQSSLWVN